MPQTFFISSRYSEIQEKAIQTVFCNSVDWVDKPKVSDGLRICWVYNPTYLLRGHNKGLFDTNPKNNLTSLPRLAVRVYCLWLAALLAYFF